jgi:hypothetical protein
VATCPQCNGEGAFSYPCKKCNGTGKFVHPVSQKIEGECRVCGGSGRFYPIWKGDRTIKTFNFPYVIRTLPSGREEFVHRCRLCRGIGTVKDSTYHENDPRSKRQGAAEVAYHALTGE